MDWTLYNIPSCIICFNSKVWDQNIAETDETLQLQSVQQHPRLLNLSHSHPIRTGSGIKVLQDMWLVQNTCTVRSRNWWCCWWKKSGNHHLGWCIKPCKWWDFNYQPQLVFGSRISEPWTVSLGAGNWSYGWMKFLWDLKKALAPQNCQVLGIVNPYPSKHFFFSITASWRDLDTIIFMFRRSNIILPPLGILEP